MKRFRVRCYHPSTNTVGYWGWYAHEQRWEMLSGRSVPPDSILDKVQADAGLAWQPGNWIVTLEVVDESGILSESEQLGSS